MKLPTNQPSCIPSAAVTATDNHYVTATTTHKAAATSAPEATPPKWCFKVNVDAAINVSNQKAGLGVVIRNSMGKVVAAAVQGAPYRGEVACMEAEAVLFSIQSAHQADCFPMIIESDSKEVVDLSLNKKTSKNLPPTTYVSRSCNSIAHSLAKIALDFESQVLWLENFPEQIMWKFSKFI